MQMLLYKKINKKNHLNYINSSLVAFVIFDNSIPLRNIKNEIYV